MAYPDAGTENDVKVRIRGLEQRNGRLSNVSPPRYTPGHVLSAKRECPRR